MPHKEEQRRAAASLLILLIVAQALLLLLFNALHGTSAGDQELRQDPFEAILVIFGRRALIFFCLKALGKK